MFKVDLPEPGPIYTYTTCCDCDQLRARNAELEAERDDYKGKMEAAINLLVLEKKCKGLLTERINELEAQLAAADKGLLKASDPNSGWQGINLECKLWQEKAEALEAEVARLRIDLEVAESMSRHSHAPCGHSSQYCYTEDGGKHIICLLCEVARLRKALENDLEIYREIQSSHKASIGSLHSHYTPQLRISSITGAVAIVRAALGQVKEASDG